MSQFLYFLLVLFGLSPLAHAQKQEEIPQMYSRLQAPVQALSAMAGNIDEMAENIPDRERARVDLFVDKIDAAVTRYSHILVIAQIASAMLDSQDYQSVLKALKSQCNFAKKIDDIAVGGMDRAIARVTSRALISELSKARDLIQSLRGTPLCA